MSHDDPARTPSELTVEVQGLRLALRAWGPEDGRPVLALHGWLDNASTFDLLAPRLAGLRILALDFPGHGRSEHRHHPSYAFLDYVADVIGVAEALGWSRFTLLGHSLGAGVAAMVAGAIPERIERLIAIEGIAPLTDAPELAPQRLRDAVTAELAHRPTPRHLADLEAAAQLRSRSSGLPLESARVLVGRSLVPDGDGVRWSFDPRLRLASRLRLTDAHVEAFLAAIACPTLLVRARSGWPFDPEKQGRLLARIRDLRIVDLDGGHHVHLESPAPVAAAVDDFLRRAIEE
ncbi:MAG: alpha/beta hydrolase [Nannocystaceae bacterium]